MVFFCLGQKFVLPSSPSKPHAALAEERRDVGADFPAERAAGVRGRRQRCDAVQAGQRGEGLGQWESGVCSRDVSSGKKLKEKLPLNCYHDHDHSHASNGIVFC